MAITLDTTSKASNDLSLTLSWSHTVAVGAKLLIVSVMHRDTVSVSSITVGGNAMTPAIAGGAGHNAVYYYVNPPSGSQTILVTVSGTTTPLLGIAASFLGTVDTVNPIGTTTDGGAISASVSSFTFNTILARANSTVIGFMGILDSFNTQAITKGSAYTEINQLAGIQDTSFASYYSSELEYQSAVSGTQAVNWTFGTTTTYGGGAVSIEIQQPITPLTPSVSDSISVTESVTIRLIDNINVQDTITVTENIKMLVIDNINVNEAVTVTESVTILITRLVPNVQDTISITESVQIKIVSFISVQDTIAVTDVATLNVPIIISVSDTISITEGVKMMEIDLINVFEIVTVTESDSMISLLNAPIVTIQSKSAPYPVISSISYVQSALGGNNLPVLGGEVSNLVYFRVYNNYGLTEAIATMENVFLTVFDGVGLGSHTGMQSPASQSWIRVYETGFGENSLPPGLYTQFLGQDTAIGRSGLDQYIPEFGSDGGAVPRIRAGVNTDGLGFIEFATYAEMPDQIGFFNYAVAISIMYDWHP